MFQKDYLFLFSSDYSAKQQEDRVDNQSVYHANVRQNIQTEIAKIKFSNYKIIESEKDKDGTIYMLVSVNRKDFNC